LSRNSHALSTKYNILYNGQIGLDKGIKAIQASNQDDFWERLPIEPMQINEDVVVTDTTKNADFRLAETKATKAIQKHSMNIGGRERNSQIDEAYLLLGKARYYDQRFVPALDAFNYILYKYPNSSKIYEAKIWREKTNMRLGNDALVVKNMTKMIKEKKLKKQVFADANALLSEAFLNLEEKDSAIGKLKIAAKFTRRNSERARYRFILGQLYEEVGKKDSALYSYESVIKMKRKSERKYVIQSQARKAQLFDYQNGDTIAFVENYKKLIADRENRPFLDVLNYQMGVFYDKQNKQKQALDFYNASLSKATTDEYLIASNYRNIGNMYFKNAKYPIAAKYYDSTLVKLNPKTREFIHIQKIRKDLDEVILYEEIAVRNDSIIKVVSLPETDRISYFENYIQKLKASDEAKRVLEEKIKEKQENIERNNKATGIEPAVSNQNTGTSIKKSAFAPPSIGKNETDNIFYFYNPTTVAFGKVGFKKIWGNRTLGGNWRVSTTTTNNNLASNDSIIGATQIDEDKVAQKDKVVEEYTTDFYLKQLPDSKVSIDSIAKERNSAYYQLGVIYKEKFKEYDLASDKLEQLLQHDPEEKLILPTLYNLYKIYQITNSAKAEEMKSRINSQYPNSRYAKIINNPGANNLVLEGTSDAVYNKLYKQFTDEEFVAVVEKSDAMITQFSGEEIVSKFELLKANAIGKLKGLTAYKDALQFVADNYPNTEEGKKAQDILITQIPLLENMNFSSADSKNWKILYKVTPNDDKKRKTIEDKIKKFIASENIQKLNVIFEPYVEGESLIIIQGFKDKGYANDVVMILKENQEFKIESPAIVISNENYKIIQIKKNLDTYLEVKNK
jgi:tetratricopeptide (TPR) repeat protein